VLSIDSGGNYHGYIGDLCRMGILGDPDAELLDLLDEIEAVQQAAFSMVKAGTLGGDVIEHAEEVLKASPSRRLHGLLRPWHGPDHPRSAVPDDQPSRPL
jgi:Xaa-Pro aminopeptidase